MYDNVQDNVIFKCIRDKFVTIFVYVSSRQLDKWRKSRVEKFVLILLSFFVLTRKHQCQALPCYQDNEIKIGYYSERKSNSQPTRLITVMTPLWLQVYLYLETQNKITNYYKVQHSISTILYTCSFTNKYFSQWLNLK